MASVLLAVSSTPSTYAPGAFPLDTLNEGPTYAFTWIPSAASTAPEFSGYEAFIAADDDGGLWTADRGIELYGIDNGSVLAVRTPDMTWSAGDHIRVVVRLAPGTGASSVTVSGAASGNGTTTFTSTLPYFTASVLGVGQYTNAATYQISGTISSIDDDAADGASGSTTAGGISSSGAAATSTSASGAVAAGAVTSVGSAGSAGPAVAFGSIGASTATQRADQTGAVTGTMSTLFSARVPGAAVSVNDRLAFNGRRWLVNTGGVLGAGSGPTGTGEQADGSATLVAMTSTDTALAMTTQTSNSVLIACLMRDQWSSDTSAPTDNMGNTFALQGAAHAYSAFPTSSSAVFAARNAAGGAGHVVSATWPQHASTGAEASLLVVEVPTTTPTSYVQAIGFVERASSSSVTSASVTTTAPAMLVAFWLGTGGVLTVGSAHPGAPVAPFVTLPNADTSVAINANGYIQGKSGWAYAASAGTYTATWTGTSEGAQLYLVAIQEQASAAASGAAVAGVTTSSGTASTSPTIGASGTAQAGGMAAAGQAGSAAQGSATSGGVTSIGSAGPPGMASGSSISGGVTSAGSAGSPSTASGAATAGGITAAGVAITTSSSGPAPGRVRIPGVSPDPEVYGGPLPGVL